MMRRPTAAGLAAALGLAPPEPEVKAAPAPAPSPEASPVPVSKPVAPVTPSPAPPRRGRMGGIVVPAAPSELEPAPAQADPAPAPVTEAAPPAEPLPPRQPPTGPRPVLRRREDGQQHPVPPEWQDEHGQPYHEWYLTQAEQQALVDAAPPGPTTRATWPGCESQLLIIDRIWDGGVFQDWVSGSRVPIQMTAWIKPKDRR